MDECFGPVDPRADDVSELIRRHLRFTGGTSPAEFDFAFGHDELVEAGVTLFGLRMAGALVAVGALKHLDDVHAELKSMHTIREARGRGHGRRILGELISTARRRGYRRISLETGSTEEDSPARALYTSAGFVPCSPFADYRESDWNAFMALTLC